MKRPNKMARYLPVLVALLCAGALAVAAGTAFARYRTDREVKVYFQVREPETIVLGTVQEGVFAPADTLHWTVSDGVAGLEFAMANGVSPESYASKDQLVQLNMVGTLGILHDGNIPTLTVTYLNAEGVETTATATAEPIAEGTALYHSYGAGWIYSFYTEDQQLLTWQLTGGQLSYVTLTVSTESELSGNLSLLQPLVSAASAN